MLPLGGPLTRTLTHLGVHANGHCVGHPHKEIHEVGVVHGVRHVLQQPHQLLRQPEAAVGGRHRHRRDVAVPVRARALHLAKDCTQ